MAVDIKVAPPEWEENLTGDEEVEQEPARGVVKRSESSHLKNKMILLSEVTTRPIAGKGTYNSGKAKKI